MSDRGLRAIGPCPREVHALSSIIGGIPIDLEANSANAPWDSCRTRNQFRQPWVSYRPIRGIPVELVRNANNLPNGVDVSVHLVCSTNRMSWIPPVGPYRRHERGVLPSGRHRYRSHESCEDDTSHPRPRESYRSAHGSTHLLRIPRTVAV